MSTVRLVLWDIDHTLITSGGVGREVFRTAFEAVTGCPMTQMAEVTGKKSGFALLEQRWRTLRHVSLSPSRVGDIAKAALILLFFEHGKIT